MPAKLKEISHVVATKILKLAQGDVKVCVLYDGADPFVRDGAS